MPVFPVGVPEDVLSRTFTVIRGRYDFSVDGGAQSTKAITTGTPIPSGATVVGGYVDILTQCTGATATIACQVEGANDILTAVAIASWTAGRKNILPGLTPGALTANTAIVRTTAARNISIVIATADLTAGKFDVVLYVIPPVS